MSSAARRPWERFDRFAIAWALASLSAVIYLAYCVETWRTALVPTPTDAKDSHGFAYASIVTAPTLLLLLAAVALLWRRDLSRHFATLVHCLVCIPVALVMTGLPSLTRNDLTLTAVAIVVLASHVAVIALLPRDAKT